MKRVREVIVACLFLVTPFLHANDSVASEASHVVGGFLIGGIATAVTDHYFPEYQSNRGWIGFWSNTAISAIILGVELAQDRSDTSGELMDFGFSVLGGAVGAYTADRFILAPLIKKAPDGSRGYGMQVTHKF